MKQSIKISLKLFCFERLGSEHTHETGVFTACFQWMEIPFDCIYCNTTFAALISVFVTIESRGRLKTARDISRKTDWFSLISSPNPYHHIYFTFSIQKYLSCLYWGNALEKFYITFVQMCFKGRNGLSNWFFWLLEKQELFHTAEKPLKYHFFFEFMLDFEQSKLFTLVIFFCFYIRKGFLKLYEKIKQYKIIFSFCFYQFWMLL